MVNIIKKEIALEESLRKKIEFICDFTNNKPTIINGSIRKIDKTNLTYIEPHKIMISNESSCLILLSYDEDNNLYLKDSLEIISLSRLSDLVLKMQKN